MMTLSAELKWRGFIQDTTFKKIEELDKKNWVFYIGFDASASSQAIGNLASMMAAQVFLRHGHRAIIVAGGATSLIGDPGGKEAERALQDKEAIAQNVSNAQKQFKKIFSRYEKQITYLNNLDWLADVKLLDFLRDIGKKFSMTPLIQRDYIANRLGEKGSGISYAEFSYTLLQGYDYLKLFEDYDCNLQLGGSDQWGNCLSGVDLIRRQHQKTVHAITLPLIVNQATGRKFGKSEEQTIWLDDQLTHPSDFYQFWLNTSDEDVLGYLKVFTDLDPIRLKVIEKQQTSDPAARIAQKTLAGEMTQSVHGQSALDISLFFSHLAFAADKKSLEAADLEAWQVAWDNILKMSPYKDQLIKVKRQKDGSFEKTQILQDLVQKIPQLASQSQAKKLLSEKALKVAVCDLKKSSQQKMSLSRYLEELTAAQQLRETQIALIIVGKNIIRPLLHD